MRPLLDDANYDFENKPTNVFKVITLFRMLDTLSISRFLLSITLINFVSSLCKNVTWFHEQCRHKCDKIGQSYLFCDHSEILERFQKNRPTPLLSEEWPFKNAGIMVISDVGERRNLFHKDLRNFFFIGRSKYFTILTLPTMLTSFTSLTLFTIVVYIFFTLITT